MSSPQANPIRLLLFGGEAELPVCCRATGSELLIDGANDLSLGLPREEEDWFSLPVGCEVREGCEGREGALLPDD